MFKQQDVFLNRSSSGLVHILCNATGYPDPRYNWTYNTPDGGTRPSSDDPCLSASTDGQV